MTGQRVGYIRVSTYEQNTDRQLEGIPLDGCFTDRASGKDTQRPELSALLAFVRDGDRRSKATVSQSMKTCCNIYPRLAGNISI